ncbi:hypothetical protein TELCIR_05525 [Teladorsagia circumcincta]|uniref:Beta-Casp domain-containing protein n=1 Tax=Teladorsagia circumcincta TaxID=45464 RepID=A0A2G9UQV9_TELCI|nr:hypothetical protein TELCIR_05525 [Teladorsagia circumcincta]
MENLLLGTENPVLGIEKPVLGMENLLLGMENLVLGIENPVLSIENAVLGIENPVLGTPKTWMTSSGFRHEKGSRDSALPQGVRSTHSRPVEWEKLQDADALILTSLSRTPDFSSEGAVIEVAQTVMDTLKRGGNVLMPVNPVGSIYDLIDVVSRSIDNAGGATLEARIYFISPVAKGALAYSNVNAEWLAESRQNAVYVPEEPFCHTAVLTGHPSLRIGDAPHLLEMWGNDSKNALIMTDPDYPLNEVYAPYEDLAIRAFYYPIETRLEFSQVNTVLLPVELKPKNLIIPEVYSLSHNSKSPSHNRIEFVVQYNSTTPMKYDEQISISLPSKKMRKRKIKISPDVIKRLELRGHYANPEIGITSLTGFLCAYDGAYELLVCLVHCYLSLEGIYCLSNHEFSE